MPLTTGTRLGPYEIGASLGQGGMGEVYRARDTRLNRDVAVKILPEAFASDPDRVARFTREAQTLAALNYTHIAQIYGVEDAETSPSGEPATRALVMELVEGETLADRLLQGPPPLDEALRIARQMADALEAAHDAGIVRRDFKPANIKVRSDGTVKVLDFGLAKVALPGARGARGASSARGAGGASRAGAGALNSPTMTSPAMTAAGMILGTAAYMSPEQARGKGVDRRADIWAFGCVLYEMLTGRAAFAGETVSDVIGTVLRDQPDWTLLPRETPPFVRHVLRRCLEKDVRDRLPHLGIARLDLTAGITAENTAVTATPRRSGRAASLGLAAVAGGVLAAAVMTLTRQPPQSLGPIDVVLEPPPGTVRFGHASPERGQGAAAPHFAPSADGRMLAFTAVEADESVHLWVRALASADARKLPGTSDASFPFWSPDGREVAFFSGGQLKRMSLDASAPATICAAADGEGGTWGTDGTILFAPTEQGGIWRVAASSNTPTQVTFPEASKAAHRWPQFVGGNAFLYHVVTQAAPARSSIRFHSLPSGTDTELLQTPSRATYAGGRVIFHRDGRLSAQRLNPSSGQLEGEAFPIVSSVAFNTGGRAAFTASDAGTLVYREGEDRLPGLRLAWWYRDASVSQIVEEGRQYGRVSLSPDDSRAMVQINTATADGTVVADLWSYDLARGVPTRFTDDPAFEHAPVWSRDGERVAYLSTGVRAEREGSLWIKASGGATPAVLVNTPEPVGPPTAWTPDQRHLIVQKLDPATGLDSYLVPVAGGPPQPLLKTRFNETDARFSPDGRWLAYGSDESGEVSVYVQPFPMNDQKTRVSPETGGSPEWSATGRELFFHSRTDVYAVGFSTNGPRMGNPQRVVANGVMVGGSGPFGSISQYYAVSRDGQRVLAIGPRGFDDGATKTLRLIINWQELLPRQ